MLAASTPVEIVPLGGGVSNDTFAVVGPGTGLVVKRALPRLRVADEWLATVERIVTEADALRLAGRITPGLVPDVVDVDPATSTLVIVKAPSSWRTWKDDLLAGDVDAMVATRLGGALARWHQSTTSAPDVAERFDQPAAFEQLRVDPYHRTVARRLPEVAGAVGRVVEAMADRRVCLVHGDFSPKNVLAGDGEVWVIDWEVAHLGDPAFDVAFLLNHLVLKSIARPQRAGAYRAAADAFVAAYRAGTGGLSSAGGEAHVVAHLGCLLLARAVGKSPAEYLDAAERERVVGLGRDVLLGGASTLAEAWSLAAD